jgi:hypothetical protein
VKWELARMMLAKNDNQGAAPLLAELVASNDPDAKQFQPEAHYWLGVVRFKAGDFAAAADEFDAALAAPGDWAAEARYLRFKALEELMSKQSTPALADRYATAMTEFIAQNQDHPMSYEAHYRLAEFRQANGQFSEAIEEYGKVAGDPSFELRARFGTLQSRFELLKTDTNPQTRQERLAAIGRDLDALWAEDKELKAKQKGAADPALQELEAKATLLQAVYVSLRGEGGDEQVAASLADFGQRFPQQQDLLPQAMRLRLGALLALGRFADAEQVVKQNADVLAKENRPDALEGLAASYAKAGARRKAQGDGTGADGASRVALALYQVLDQSGGGRADAKQKLTEARLRESTNDWNAAAALYGEVLAADADSLAALRGLAHAEEQQGKSTDALTHWQAYTAKIRPGDAGWYEGQYQQARLLLAGGDKQRSCELLTKLRPSMPGVGNADLRGQLDELYKQACG